MTTRFSLDRRSHLIEVCAVFSLFYGAQAFSATPCPENTEVNEIRANPDGTLMLWNDDGTLLDAKGPRPSISSGFTARVVECRRSETDRLIYRVRISETQFVWLNPANVSLRVATSLKCESTSRPVGINLSSAGISCATGENR